MELSTVPSFNIEGSPTIISGNSSGMGGTRIAIERFKMTPNRNEEIIAVESLQDGWHIDIMVDRNKAIYALKFSKVDVLANGDNCLSEFLVNYSENNAAWDNTRFYVFISTQIQSKSGKNPILSQTYCVDSDDGEVYLLGLNLNGEFGIIGNESGYTVFNTERVYEYELNEVFYFPNGAFSLHQKGFQLCDSGLVIGVGVNLEILKRDLIYALVSSLKRNTFSLILSENESDYLKRVARPRFLEDLIACYDLTTFSF